MKVRILNIMSANMEEGHEYDERMNQYSEEKGSSDDQEQDCV